ncbi:MAG: DUF4147 domain-containing protein [Chlorobia bacterium]|nr:DUF4147 domain-containing protein [Fimbriimonadaceae bacterium]
MRIEATPRNRAGELSLEIYAKTLALVRGDRLVKNHVSLNGHHLLVDDLRFNLTEIDRVVVAGAGKAAPAMAQGLEEILGQRIHDGLIVTKHGHAEPLQYCQTIEASHPIPGEDSLKAGEMMLRFGEKHLGTNLVLFLLSGGASALMESPVDGVSLDDLQLVNRELLASGATILTINAIRSRLSKVKAGGLARAFGEAAVVVLALSDVEGDRLGVIGSGPFVPPKLIPNLAELLSAYSFDSKFPPHILRSLKEPSPSHEGEEPAHRILGNARTMGKAAKAVAEELGLNLFEAIPMQGEAREFPSYIAQNDLFPGGRFENDCLIAVGETVVRKMGDGLGGRAQEMGCVFADQVAGDSDVAVLVAGSDGTDGPTDAAGALVDGETITRARERGFTVEQTLAENDSYHFHEAAATLVKTGPTGTNLNDIVVVVRAV